MEKLRQKIWGDKPPGPEDPFRNDSELDRQTKPVMEEALAKEKLAQEKLAKEEARKEARKAKKTKKAKREASQQEESARQEDGESSLETPEAPEAEKVPKVKKRPDRVLRKDRIKGKDRAMTRSRVNVPKVESPFRRPAKRNLAGYKPATTGDGLESVGVMGNWWEDAAYSKQTFTGFLPPHRITDTEEMTAALHRALVEVYVTRAKAPQRKNLFSFVGIDKTRDVQITPSARGADLQFTKDSSLDEVLRSLSFPKGNETAVKQAPTESEEAIAADRSTAEDLDIEEGAKPVDESTDKPADKTAEKSDPTESEEDVAADRSDVDPLQESLQESQPTLLYRDLIASWDPSWLQVSVESPEIKFDVSLSSN